jgi:hypothetical protein
VISRIFRIVGWPIPAVGCEEVTDLIQLFSWFFYIYMDQHVYDNFVDDLPL